MTNMNDYVSLLNTTGEMLWLRVRVGEQEQTWSLPNGGSQTVNSTEVNFLEIHATQPA